GLFWGAGAAAAATVARETQRSVVQIRTRSGAGSGVVWRTPRQVITNHHVVSTDRVVVETIDGVTREASVVARDPANDLALLEAQGEPLPAPPARLGDSRALRVGQLVLAVGNPLGMKNVVTAGVISAPLLTLEGRELVRATVELRPGNSGGPLVDADGAVVAINAMVVGPKAALAIPAHVVEQGVGRPSAPRLGIAGREVAIGATTAQRAGVTETLGVVLTEVAPGSPADRSGLLPGDIILRVNGRSVGRARDLSAVLASRNPTEPVRFRVLRGGAPTDIVGAPVSV
ncbi:MAG: S1C family serine protease, partial [Dehalococcoidia bacterium]|nr:S1C family serine protease [Dehalococcoidia bacterium]